MPVLKKLNKTIRKIESWQEECANLQYALSVLLRESGGTSIADVAVAPEAMGDVEDDEKKKKKKKMNEAKLAGNVKDKDRMGNDVIVTPEGETQKLTRQQAKEMHRNGDGAEGEQENGSETKSDDIKYTTPKPVLIKKTIDILKTDKRLQTLINKFYDYRSAGNVGKSDEMRTIIDEFISARGLDPLTVYASYDLDLGEDDVETEEPEEEPEDTEDDSEDTEEEK